MTHIRSNAYSIYVYISQYCNLLLYNINLIYVPMYVRAMIQCNESCSYVLNNYYALNNHMCFAARLYSIIYYLWFYLAKWLIWAVAFNQEKVGHRSWPLWLSDSLVFNQWPWDDHVLIFVFKLYLQLHVYVYAHTYYRPV